MHGHNKKTVSFLNYSNVHLLRVNSREKLLLIGTEAFGGLVAATVIFHSLHKTVMFHNGQRSPLTKSETTTMELL
jgi:hypothetical protein